MKNHKQFSVTPDLKLSNDTNVLEIRVYYSAGGRSFLTGENSQQGIYLSISPVEKQTRNGMTTTSFTMFGGKQGLKTILCEASRYNENKLREISHDLEINREKSLLYGETYQQLLTAVLNKNNFVLATSDEEVYTPPTFEVGQKVLYREKVGVVLEVKDYSINATQYKVVFDDFSTKMLQSYNQFDKDTSNLAEAMLKDGEKQFCSSEALTMLKLKVQQKEQEFKDEQERQAKERAERIKGHLATLQATYPNAKQEATSDHARASYNIKQELQAAFPWVKFSVTSDSFSMGNSVDVRWEDGVTKNEVEAIIKKYQYGTFDPMTDTSGFKNDEFSVACQEWLGSAKYVHANRTQSERVKNQIAEVLRGNGIDLSRSWEFFNNSSVTGKEIDEFFPNQGKFVFTDEFVKAPPIQQGDGVTIRRNEEKNGIEIRFASKPPVDTIIKVKSAGFRCSRRPPFFWYAKQSPRTIAFAESLVG